MVHQAAARSELYSQYWVTCIMLEGLLDLLLTAAAAAVLLARWRHPKPIPATRMTSAMPGGIGFLKATIEVRGRLRRLAPLQETASALLPWRGCLLTLAGQCGTAGVDTAGLQVPVYMAVALDYLREALAAAYEHKNYYSFVDGANFPQTAELSICTSAACAASMFNWCTAAQQQLASLRLCSLRVCQVPADAHVLDVVFADSESASGFFDNNGGLDYHIPVEGGRGVMPGLKVGWSPWSGPGVGG